MSGDDQNDAPKEKDAPQQEKPSVLTRIKHMLADKRTYFVLPVLAVVFFLPFQWAVNGVADWFRDHHVLYNPTKEGLISVASPQLFTRERLINQRLAESRWIDGRIAAIDDMMKDNRFGKPYAFISQNSSLSGSGQRAYEQADGAADTADNVNYVSPKIEFEAANEYRQDLVRQKFQSILDDAHDTSSNTLQRLNFNLTVSPARHHSRALAAVSITLEEPTDPEWILQKYGELLFDVRDELQQTADNMIADRSSIIRFQENYSLLAQTESVFREAIDAAHKENGITGTDWREQVDQWKSILLAQFDNQMIFHFQNHLETVGNNPLVRSRLNDIFFYLHDDARAQLVNELRNTCNLGPTSIWSLFPVERRGPSVSSDLQYRGFEKELVAFLNSGETTSGTENWRDLNEFREVFLNRNVTVPCPPSPEQVAYQAMLRVFGELSLNEKQVTGWQRNCKLSNYLQLTGKQTFEDANLQALNDNFDDVREFFTKCAVYWRALDNIGVVHLVKAELNETPIDTSGRLRRLRDYFVVSTEDCDWHSCQLVVRTKSEDYLLNAKRQLLGSTGAEAKIFDRFDLRDGDGNQLKGEEFEKLSNAERADHKLAAVRNDFGDYQIVFDPPKPVDKGVRLKDIQLNALTIGRQEALRLFSELSCYASARSYTVYPLKGLGETSLEQRQNSWSLPSLFGQTGTNASFDANSAVVTRPPKILGIGDTGKRVQSSEAARECSAAFLAILNELDPDKFEEETMELVEATRHLEEILKRPATGEAEKWRRYAICVLDEIVDLGTDVSPTEARMTECTDGFDNDVPPTKWEGFDLLHLTAAVRYMRQRKTTISWVLHPENSLLFVSRHPQRSIPVSAIVSLPSWWPGIEITTETCWLRPKRLHVESGRSLCPEVTAEPATWLGRLVHSEKARSRARVAYQQIIPLPFSLEDVLPKLGFFLVRYPYIDRIDADDIHLESGREVELRLTGKRLWKNPMVRLGEQWSTKVEVLPDMEGIRATFECLEPLPAGQRKQSIQFPEHVIKLETSPPAAPGDGSGWYAVTASENTRDMVFSEERPVQVWTSEGKTQHVAVLVSAFRPRHFIDGRIEAPCWAKKELTDLSASADNPTSQ